MKIMRFKINEEVSYGYLENDNTITKIDGDIFGEHNKTNVKINLSDVKILPPTAPSKIVAIGLNYAAHAEEFKADVPPFPIIFLKSPTTVIAHEENIIYPKQATNHVEYEAELAIVIGKTAKNIEKENAKDYILGYTCLNDVTARDIQKQDGQWTRAKNFDTFGPVGPVISNELDPDNAWIKSYVNGELKQDSNTNLMIHKTDYLVSEISKIMTLYPGDIISTGTPAGASNIETGTYIEIEIEGIGKLCNKIV